MEALCAVLLKSKEGWRAVDNISMCYNVKRTSLLCIDLPFYSTVKPLYVDISLMWTLLSNVDTFVVTSLI